MATETWLERAARLLGAAEAEAQSGEGEQALATANEAVFALRVELGEEDPPAGVDARRSE